MKLKPIYLILLFLVASCAKKTNYLLSKNLYEQSLLEYKNKNYNRALQLVNEAIAKYKSPQAEAQKAILLYQLGKYNESMALFKTLIKDAKISPTIKTDIQNNYACTLLNLNKASEAKEIWLNLTTQTNYLSPEVAWYNIGLLELLESKKLIDPKKALIEAENAFINALKISKEYIDAQFYLAITQIMLDKKEAARKNLIELITSTPEHTSAQAVLNSLDAETTINWS